MGCISSTPPPGSTGPGSPLSGGSRLAIDAGLVRGPVVAVRPVPAVAAFSARAAFAFLSHRSPLDDPQGITAQSCATARERSQDHRADVRRTSAAPPYLEVNSRPTTKIVSQFGAPSRGTVRRESILLATDKNGVCSPISGPATTPGLPEFVEPVTVNSVETQVEMPLRLPPEHILIRRAAPRPEIMGQKRLPHMTELDSSPILSMSRPVSSWESTVSLPLEQVLGQPALRDEFEALAGPKSLSTGSDAT